MKEIRLVVSRHSVFYTPLIGVIARGFLEKENLQASYSVAGNDAISQVVNKEADIAQSAVSASWGVMEQGNSCQGSPVVHFAQINRHDGFFIARSPKSKLPFDWQILRNGKFIHVPQGQPLVMLKYALNLKGIDINSVYDRDAPYNRQLSTNEWIEECRKWGNLSNDRFFYEQGPYPQQLQEEGIAYVVASVGEVIGPVAFSSLCCRWERLGADSTKRFISAYRKSRIWAATSPSVEVAKAITDFFPGYSQKAISDTVEFYQRLGTWGGDIAIEPALYEKALDIFLADGSVTIPHAFDLVVQKPPV